MSPSLEERVAYLEGRTEDVTRVLGDLRGSIVNLQGDLNARFDHVESRFNQIDARFGQVDARFGQVDDRLNHIDGKLDMFRQDVSRQFTWLVGIQFAILLAVIGALLGT